MSSDIMEVTLKAYQIIEKTATATGSSAHVFVPKEWVGKKIKVVLLEQISKKEVEQPTKSKKISRKSNFPLKSNQSEVP
jgi:putative transposon-encoded protein